ncbi:MAG: cytochrome c [Dehalococcoidia bacterium]
MTGNRIRPARGLLLALATTSAVLAIACSGAAGSKAGATSASEPNAPAPAAATPPPPTGDPEKDLIARGEVIFQQTAGGGAGCKMCHGVTGRGDGVANLGAPNIRGLDITRIRPALNGGVPVMQFIKLNDDEMEAVAAYVKSLGGQ